jgi:hypothetical protein
VWPELLVCVDDVIPPPPPLLLLFEGARTLVTLVSTKVSVEFVSASFELWV